MMNFDECSVILYEGVSKNMRVRFIMGNVRLFLFNERDFIRILSTVYI